MFDVYDVSDDDVLNVVKLENKNSIGCGSGCVSDGLYGGGGDGMLMVILDLFVDEMWCVWCGLLDVSDGGLWMSEDSVGV